MKLIPDSAYHWFFQKLGYRICPGCGMKLDSRMSDQDAEKAWSKYARNTGEPRRPRLK